MTYNLTMVYEGARFLCPSQFYVLLKFKEPANKTS